MNKHYCKRCFKTVVDSAAPDSFLLMSAEKVKCPSCGNIDRVVSVYFKYGEHTVTQDGSKIIGQARHVGINPNYSFFNNSYPYADVEKYHN